MTRRYIIIALASIAILTGIIYSNTLNAPFVFDDIGAIVEADRTLSSFPLGFIGGTRSVSYYTIDLNKHFHGLDTTGFHITNIIIHIASAWATFFLIYTLSQTIQKTTTFHVQSLRFTNHFILAVFAGLLFASHPIQTSATTYIVQRLASITGLLYILALLFYAKYRTSKFPKSWAIASLGATILAMHSKEIAITIPIAIVLMEIIFFSKKIRQFAWRLPHLLPWLILIVIIPTYMLDARAFIMTALNIPTPASIAPEGTYNISNITKVMSIKTAIARSAETKAISRTEYFLTELSVQATYIRLLLLPINQNADYDYPIAKTLFEKKTLASGALIITLIALAFYLYYKQQKLPAFGILFFFLALSVESSIFPIEDVIFEYRLYLPFIGYVAVTCAILQYILTKTKNHTIKNIQTTTIVVIITLTIITSYAIATYRRNNVWKSEISLWQDVTEKSPNKPRPYNNLGMYYFGQGDKDTAERNYKKAIELDLEYSVAQNNLGMLYITQNRFNEAFEILTRAIETNPTYAHAHNNLGAVYLHRKNTKEAEASFRKSIAYDNNYIASRDNLGTLLLNKGDIPSLDEAEKHLLIAISIKETAKTYNNLGVIYAKRNETKKAIEYFRKALKINPSFQNAINNLNALTKKKVPPGMKTL